MKMTRWIGRSLAVAVLVGALGAAGYAAADEEDAVVVTGIHDDDLAVRADHLQIEATVAGDVMAAGGRVDVRSQIAGDLFAAGRKLTLGDRIDGSLIAAGGDVSVKGRVGNDANVVGGQAAVDARIDGDALAVGGDLSLEGEIKGDLRAVGGRFVLHNKVGGNAAIMGGRVDIREGAQIAGKATIGGARLYIGGQFDRTLKAAAREIIIAGQIGGDVNLNAKEITLLPSARIGGDLVYRSPEAMTIHDSAQIAGDVTFVQSDLLSGGEGGLLALAGSLHLIIVLGLVLVAAVLVVVFPTLFPAIDRRLVRRPWPALGVGLGVLVAGPLIIAALLVTGIGVLLALILGAAYFLAVIIGIVASTFVVGRKALSLIKHREGTSAMHLVVTSALGMILLGVIALIPVVGAIVVVLAAALGIGALVLETASRRTSRLGRKVAAPETS
jgi:cytoskeletal protein CcmA (bactofilin family)